MEQSIKQLFEQIEAGYRQLTLTLAAIDPETAQTKLVGDWTACDMLAHIIAWKEEAIKALTALRDGTYERRKYDFDTWNAEAVASRRGRSWHELQHELAVVQQRLMSLAHEMPETFWNDKRSVGWLRAVTVEHYDEHMEALLALSGTTELH